MLRMSPGWRTDRRRGVLDGELANDLPPRERGVAMVFQDYALYPHMSVGENIGFPLQLAG